MKYKHSTIVLIVLFLLFFRAPLSSSVFAQETSKYTVKERFGVGQDQHIGSNAGKTIDRYPWQKLGIGWYFDWGSTGGPRQDLSYMGLVGGWGPREPNCPDLTQKINNDRAKYPDGMLWTIGNEIGLDDARTAQIYSEHFVLWYDCLKNINPAFKVGSGAIVDPRAKLPAPTKGQVECTTLNNPQSGANYFKTYINNLPSNKRPDFIVNHGYTFCKENGPGSLSSLDEFKESIKTQRQLMKELGLQTKDLLIKEWGPIGPSISFEQRQSYLKDTTEYMLNAKDADLGNPDDGYRLVQRWAWFVLNDWEGKYRWDRSVALANTFNGELTPLGDLYRQLIRTYTSPSEKADDRFGIGNWNANLGLLAGRGWGGGHNSFEKQRLNSNIFSYFNVGKIDNLHYSNLNPGAWDNHPKCKNPADNSIVNCIAIPHTGIPNDESYADIDSLAQQYKNQVWEITNEPNWYPYINPQDYVVWFHLFSKKIRQADPSAKISIGGLLLVVEYSNYITVFRNYYKQLYGDYPLIDVWNIHPYSYVLDPNTPISYIKDFRNLLEGLPESSNVSEKNKPIYITEFGILGKEGDLTTGRCSYHGCLTQLNQEKEWDLVADFMKQVTDWLKDYNNLSYSQYWFWFYFGSVYKWDHLNNVGVIDLVKNFNYDPAFPPPAGIDPASIPPIFPNDIVEISPLGIALARLAKSSAVFNKSFEAFDANKEPYAYSFWAGGPGSDYTSKVVEDEKHVGNRSLRIHVGNQAGQYGNVAVINQTLETTYYSGKTVKMSAFCKTSNNGKAGLKITITNTKGQRNSYWLSSVVTPRECLDWTKLETPNVTIPSDTIKVEFEGMATGANSDVWFDDFDIQVITASPTPTPIPCPRGSLGNLDCSSDGCIDTGDFELFRPVFGQSVSTLSIPPAHHTPDLVEDSANMVDTADYEIFRNNFGRCN